MACFQFFPPLVLVSVELARQGFYGDIVQGAEPAPEDKPLVKLPGFV